MLRLILVRHGQSEADIVGKHEGRADFQLTELGQKQGSKVADYLSTYYGIDQIYCSPLKRAKRTAELIADKIKREPVEVQDLMEMDNGHLAGLTFQEAEAKFPVPTDGFKIFRALPGGESIIDFRMRIEKFWHEFYDVNFDPERQNTVCIVAHGGTISMLMKTILELPVGTKAKFPTADTGVHVLEITESGVVYLKGNSVEHLMARD